MSIVVSSYFTILAQLLVVSLGISWQMTWWSLPLQVLRAGKETGRPWRMQKWAIQFHSSVDGLPSGKVLHNYGTSSYFSWINLNYFDWSIFSIAHCYWKPEATYLWRFPKWSYCYEKPVDFMEHRMIKWMITLGVVFLPLFWTGNLHMWMRYEVVSIGIINRSLLDDSWDFLHKLLLTKFYWDYKPQTRTFFYWVSSEIAKVVPSSWVKLVQIPHISFGFIVDISNFWMRITNQQTTLGGYHLVNYHSFGSHRFAKRKVIHFHFQVFQRVLWIFTRGLSISKHIAVLARLYFCHWNMVSEPCRSGQRCHFPLKTGFFLASGVPFGTSWPWDWKITSNVESQSTNVMCLVPPPSFKQLQLHLFNL